MVVLVCKWKVVTVECWMAEAVMVEKVERVVDVTCWTEPYVETSSEVETFHKIPTVHLSISG